MRHDEFRSIPARRGCFRLRLLLASSFSIACIAFSSARLFAEDYSRGSPVFSTQDESAPDMEQQVKIYINGTDAQGLAIALQIVGFEPYESRGILRFRRHGRQIGSVEQLKQIPGVRRRFVDQIKNRITGSGKSLAISVSSESVAELRNTWADSPSMPLHLLSDESIEKELHTTTSPARLYLIGVYYAERDNMLAAIECFKKVVAADPEFLEAWKRLGKYYKDQSDYPKAIDAYQHIVALDCNDPKADDFLNLGQFYKMTGMRQKAVQNFNRAVLLYEHSVKNEPQDKNTFYYDMAQACESMAECQDSLAEKMRAKRKALAAYVKALHSQKIEISRNKAILKNYYAKNPKHAIYTDINEYLSRANSNMIGSAEFSEEMGLDPAVLKPAEVDDKLRNLKYVYEKNANCLVILEVGVYIERCHEQAVASGDAGKMEAFLDQTNDRARERYFYSMMDTYRRGHDQLNNSTNGRIP